MPPNPAVLLFFSITAGVGKEGREGGRKGGREGKKGEGREGRRRNRREKTKGDTTAYLRLLFYLAVRKNCPKSTFEDIEGGV